MAMNSKQRVKNSLARIPTDRVPVFMWYQPSTAKCLADLLEIPVPYLAEALGDDIRQTWVNNNYAMEGIVHERDGESHTDDWGVVWTREGEFNQIASSPLERATPEQVLEYRFPTENYDSLLARMEPVAEEAERYFIGVDVSPCAFEMYWRLRGLERAILDFAEYPDLVDAMHGKCADFAVELSRRACDRYPVDWLWTGDDVAGQRNLVMSPGSWRSLVKPHLARVVAEGKRRGLPVAYHCCGALRPIIGDLVEIGIDVLNPIQCNCPGMEPAELKREFGRHLSFMGGVDTQGLLPSGSAEEVRKATAHLIETMTSDGGGYILAASHTVPPETPLENIFAMYEVAGIGREEIFDRAADVRKLGAALVRSD
jgi:uroporphyrinogen decarboxylase